ncbi:MAG TPA: prenyltransferase/squalene oxidase repeat-containing protein [Verrucomicrobiales bacterium]|jgi:squalene-hopene/tetraprenyl-beta-curcumene cyclase|nr:prenyltransferase/squalene oxidase repeat-containing protein [Verrucomicrobiales bacterium]
MTRKSILTGLLCSLTLSFLRPEVSAQTTDESLRNEVQAAITKGIRYLKSKQDAATGTFGSSDNPAITALGAMAIMGDPEVKGKPMPVEAKKAYDFLLSSQKPDGGIYTKSLANYNTSLALTALTVAGREAKYRDAILKAQRYIVGSQTDEGEKGKTDGEFDGGVGYGSKPPSDMSNTHFALEALHHARIYLQDDPAPGEPKLNYAAAIDFVSKCQNLTATNKSSWASDDPKNKGGFIYRPGESKAAEKDDLGNGKTALRSYASMSYAGLLSFIYAELDPKDQRVKAVKEWLAKNYSVTENPGIGQEGLYYYYHTMAKALSLAQMDFVESPDGKRHNWRADLAKQMFNLQKEDGSWTNEQNGRWMEKDSILVTAYSVLALEHLIRRL